MNCNNELKGVKCNIEMDIFALKWVDNICCGRVVRDVILDLKVKAYMGFVVTIQLLSNYKLACMWHQSN